MLYIPNPVFPNNSNTDLKNVVGLRIHSGSVPIFGVCTFVLILCMFVLIHL